MMSKRKDLDDLLSAHDNHSDVEDHPSVLNTPRDVAIASSVTRSLKRPRVDNGDRQSMSPEGSPESPPPPASKSFADAIQALNESLLASITTQLQIDPSSDLTPITRAYEVNVRELRKTLLALTMVANALELVQDEQESAQVEFVASSDVAEMGERELGENEVYFGASLDLNAFSSSSRQVESFVPMNEVTCSSQQMDGGFLASTNTISSSSVWNDPTLLQMRLSWDVFQLHRQLDSGEEDENWLGTCHQRPVVLKRLAPNAQTMTKAITFALHIKTIASLQHPNIVQLIGVAWDTALGFQVAIEYMDRADLHSLLKTPDAAALGWTDTKCHVAIQIADALAYIHNQTRRAVPCQITSRKVLIDTSGTTKLQLVQVSSASFQLPWTAPEVVRGEPRLPYCDIYTLGVLLCELDTLRVPYETATGLKLDATTLAQDVANGKLLPTLSDTCPQGIRSVAEQCIGMDPTQRPSAERVAYALKEVLKNEL